jgi:hypothetical protein
MNGRMYDYQLGRFLSVDPVIQLPTNSQSLNPYSYIMNNPLSGMEPSGYKSCAEMEAKAGSSCTINQHDNRSADPFSGRTTISVGTNGTVTTRDSTGAAIGSYTESLAADGSTQYIQNGARSGLGAVPASQTDGAENGASDIGRTPGQQHSTRIAEAGSAMMGGLYTGLNAFAPQNATDVAIMAGAGPLLNLGGKALRLGGSAGDALGGALNGIEDAAKLRMASREAELVGVGAKGEAFRAFNAGNFAENLRRYTGVTPQGAHAHHVFVKQRAEQFGRLGINVHDPRFGAWVNARSHLFDVHGQGRYNAEWGRFFSGNPTAAGAFQLARDQAVRYGYQVSF